MMVCYEPELCQAGKELKDKWVGMLGKHPPVEPDAIYIAILNYFRHKLKCRECNPLIGMNVRANDKSHWN